MSISVFEAIGPIMVGPSSSHTGGAMRLAQMARGFFDAPILEAHFTLYGSFKKTYKGHGTDRALVAGILGMELRDPRVIDALDIAKEEGPEIFFYLGRDGLDIHPNTVDIRLVGEEGDFTLTGESIGGGRIHISMINEMEVDFHGDKPTLICQQRNVPGVIAHIASCIQDINISSMKVYEKNRAIAFTIIELDNETNKETLLKLQNNPNILEVISL